MIRQSRQRTLIPPAALHVDELALRAAVWAVLIPAISLPVQRRSEELRERVGLGPKLRALQATMLAAPDSRETLVRAAPGLAGCEVVALVEPDSVGSLVVTASNDPELTGIVVPEEEQSLVHRTFGSELDREIANQATSEDGTTDSVFEAVQKIYDEFVKAMRDPKLIERWNGAGLEVTPSASPAAYTAFIKEEVARWAPVVKASGARVDN